MALVLLIGNDNLKLKLLYIWDSLVLTMMLH
jgi:hypothetical protein